jgi:fucokinase
MVSPELHLDWLAHGWALMYLSIKNPDRIPGWDAVVLTAASPSQAELYRLRLEAARKLGRLSPRVLTLVAPDPEGRRIGSGGATLHALRALAQAQPATDWARRRILLVHAGGDSRRVPWANILGKPFIPLPLLADPDRAVPTLLDHLLAIAAPVAYGMTNGGLLTLAGDVLPLFPSGRLRIPNDGGLVVTVPVALDVAERHGVICADERDRVVDLLQKLPAAELAGGGALVSGGAALLDTGIYAFAGAALRGLLGLACSTPEPVSQLVDSGREISLYEELAAGLVPRKAGWLRARPLGPRILEALSGQALVNARFDELSFIHLGATSEVLAQFNRFWHGRFSRRILSECGEAVAETALLCQARLAGGVRVGEASFVYASLLGEGTRIGNRCVVVGVDDRDEPFQLPDNHCLWQVLVKGASPLGGPDVVTACCGVDDNPKDRFEEGTFCNRSFPLWLADHGVAAEELWPEGQPRTLWRAKLFPGQVHPADLLIAAWILGDGQAGAHLRDQWRRAPRHSLADLHANAETSAWFHRQETITTGLVMRALRRTVDGVLERNAAALAEQLATPALRARAAAMAERLPPPELTSPLAPASRLYQLRADLLQTGSAEEEFSLEAFDAVQREVALALPRLEPQPVRGLEAGRSERVELPVRLDIAGGWSDTPPYCLERPARVLNLAMTLDGQLPIGAEVRALAEPRWELVLEDQDRQAALREPAQLAAPPDPADPFALLRVALLLTGYGSAQGVTQGARVRTWSRVPKGSGLGASSILGAALLRALQRLAGRPDDIQTLCALVLTLEQRLTTGGGWQDQIGGLAPGVKCISSLPVRPLKLSVEPVPLLPPVAQELHSRLVIAFTGQARLAKNVLHIVVGRYLQRDVRVTGAIGRLVELADEGRQALALGDLDALGAMMSEVWQLHQRLDPHCSNLGVDLLFQSVSDLACGGKLAGAGGGGFMAVMAKDATAAARVRERLKEAGRELRLYEWKLWTIDH